MTEKTDLFGKARETRVQTRAAAKSMMEFARMVALAGIGAAALAKDETEQLASRLVERGAQARRELAGGLGSRAPQRCGWMRGRAERRMNRMLNRLNVPSRDDVAAINAKLATLSAKIDAMQATPGAIEDIEPSSQI
jgi:polyhydroxyalkanoate synthesis regulator phasin